MILIKLKEFWNILIDVIYEREMLMINRDLQASNYNKFD